MSIKYTQYQRSNACFELLVVEVAIFVVMAEDQTAARAAQLEGERYLRLLLRSTIEHSPPLPVVRAVALASDPPKRTNSVRSLTVKERMSVPGAISARRLIEEA